MQQAPPLPPLKPKGKEQKAKELAVAEHAQPDNGQPARHQCVHLCAGTGIVSVCLTYCCPSPLHPTYPPPTLLLVWWGNLGDPRWFHGEVTEWDLHRQNGFGMHEVSYRDGDKKWHYLDGPSSGTKKVKWALQSGSASA